MIKTIYKGLNLFTKIQVIQAVSFLLIPFILWGVHGERLGSISAYANATPMLFAFLLTLAGMLFINDGLVSKGRWYNYIIGLSLFGVVLFTCFDFPIIHYIFAGVFFIGSLFNMVFFSSNKERWFKALVAFGVLFGMAGCFLLKWYSIFWAEFIGMIPISIHYVLETTGKID